MAGVFFARLVEVLAFALGAAFAFVVLAAEAFFGAALVAAVFVSVFFGLPAVLVPAGLAALVAFYKTVSQAFDKIWAPTDVPWQMVSFPWWRRRQVWRRVPS